MGESGSSLDRLSDKLPKLRKLAQYERRALALVQEFFVADPDDLRTVLNDDDFEVEGALLSKGDLDQILYVTKDGSVHVVWEGGASFLDEGTA